ncbi:hypothetical protein BBK14_33695 [Parafrankia soli]|uniref:Uncharacterized protein n=1 Tax=Parafrankia soli TaxID=2599596 RepID=A0A1S1QJF0_9ACTN|nr:hypothetical protein [Parafrankia soli]OHV33192.1 hypothetical protein BBK14_33695 [Parafrankia soli]
MHVPPQTSEDGTVYAAVQAEPGLVTEVYWLLTSQDPGGGPIVVGQVRGCVLARLAVAAFAEAGEI